MACQCERRIKSLDSQRTAIDMPAMPLRAVLLALAEDSQALVYQEHLDGCDASEYLAAEDRASRARLGVWQVPGGITRPWDFRRQRSATTGQRRYRCSEISSYERAQKLLQQGHTYLDGNGDGFAYRSLR